VQVFSEYDFDLYHIPGKDNTAADALSRRPDHFLKSDTTPTTTSHQLKVQCAQKLRDMYNKLMYNKLMK